MVIDMATFAIPMFIHVDIDDEIINAIPEEIVLNNVEFDKAIENLIKEEFLASYQKDTGLVSLHIPVDDIPYSDYVYEG